MKIGIFGGGQLGWMLGCAGAQLGHECVFLDPKSDACAASVGTLIVGTFDDPHCIQKLMQQSDVITYETENLPEGCIDVLESSGLDVFPSLAALRITQDRWEEKTLCRQLGIPTVEFEPVDSETELQSAMQTIGFPSILKTRRMGYDGKGQVVIREDDDLVDAVSLCSQPCILERMVTFDRELSIIATRSRDGEIVYYPLTENVHRENILHTSRAPATTDADTEQAARTIAEKLLSYFDYVGTMAVELFQLGDGQLVLNEIAPRVHNSGHWTIEGAETSQFENHIRAISGSPLGSSMPCGHSGMVNIIGTYPSIDTDGQPNSVHVYFYDKEERPKRKIGHITVCHTDPEIVASQMDDLVDIVSKN